ncbi:hypothetical protein NQ036_07790 [Brevibacterium sp. 91QC2O2]|jgi:hypothetical protein|uniref:hypothetical protein n=1 Tax=Brevibacterium sp. 91QC2O2 TaxID=2968458 RepID=UPI00211C4390|nr:hypothetical protein [Brevibacterium sp. 91QC2O2]MCQ9368142.1 hypothetical protein [Brevibacterium sp. 91QC2O2]
MSDSSGREWALQMLGPDGVQVREIIPTIIRLCHEKMANAQAEAEMAHSGVYGQIWRKCLSEFIEALGGLPTAELVPQRGYTLVSFNGVILFPWRFARDSYTDLNSRPFGVSATRISLLTQAPEFSQQRFDMEFPHPELTKEELDLGIEAQAIRDAYPTHKVVVIAYASSPSKLFSIRWGDAVLGTDRRLTFNTLESLLDVTPNNPVNASPSKTDGFSTGPIPRPLLGAKEEEAGGETHA